MTHTQRLPPNLRTRDYVRALRRWSCACAEHEAGAVAEGVAEGEAEGEAEAEAEVEPIPVVVVESSGANLTHLRAAVAEPCRGPPKCRRRHIEFVSHRLPTMEDTTVGKGTAEFASIKAALANSPLLKNATHVTKATGRYFIPELDSELHRIARGGGGASLAASAAEAAGGGAVGGTGDGGGAGEGRGGEGGGGGGAGGGVDGGAAQQPTCAQLLGLDGSNVGEGGNGRGGGSLESLPLRPCVVVQSTPSPWSLWDGVLRSEVVGWEVS